MMLKKIPWQGEDPNQEGLCGVCLEPQDKAAASGQASVHLPSELSAGRPPENPQRYFIQGASIQGEQVAHHTCSGMNPTCLELTLRA